MMNNNMSNELQKLNNYINNTSNKTNHKYWSTIIQNGPNPTLKNSVWKVQNLWTGFLESADPEDKLIFDIDDELKDINANRKKITKEFYTITQDDDFCTFAIGQCLSKINAKNINKNNTFKPVRRGSIEIGRSRNRFQTLEDSNKIPSKRLSHFQSIVLNTENSEASLNVFNKKKPRPSTGIIRKLSFKEQDILKVKGTVQHKMNNNQSSSLANLSIEEKQNNAWLSVVPSNSISGQNKQMNNNKNNKKMNSNNNSGELEHETIINNNKPFYKQLLEVPPKGKNVEQFETEVGGVVNSALKDKKYANNVNQTVVSFKQDSKQKRGKVCFANDDIKNSINPRNSAFNDDDSIKKKKVSNKENRFANEMKETTQKQLHKDNQALTSHYLQQKSSRRKFPSARLRNSSIINMNSCKESFSKIKLNINDNGQKAKFAETTIASKINKKLAKGLSSKDSNFESAVNSWIIKSKENEDLKFKSMKYFQWNKKELDTSFNSNIRNIISIDDQKVKQFEHICNGWKDSFVWKGDFKDVDDILREDLSWNSAQLRELNIHPKELIIDNDFQAERQKVKSRIENNLSQIYNLNPKMNVSVKPTKKQSKQKVDARSTNIKSGKQGKENKAEVNGEELKCLKMFIREMKYRTWVKNKHIYDSFSDEEAEDDIEGTVFIHPTCTFKVYFDLFIALFSFFSIFYSPINLAYGQNKKIDLMSWHCIWDYVIDSFFLIDIIIGFFTAFYDAEEQWVTRLKRIVWNYLSNWFVFDLVTGTPFNTIINSISVDGGRQRFSYISDEYLLWDWFQLLRIIKIYKVFQLNALFEKVQKAFSSIEAFVRYIRMYTSLWVFFWSVHVLTCVFIFIGQLDYPNWIYSNGYEMTQTGQIYLTSFYYICATVFTIGYGDIVSVSIYERCFNWVLLFVGIMIYSWAVTSISTYVQSVDNKTIEHQKKVSVLEQLKVTHEKMPSLLFDKINRFWKYQLHNEKKDKNEIIDNLPIGLRNTLILEMYKDVINNFVFFRTFNNADFIIRVILAFKLIKSIKNERLVHEGDYIEEIFFVKKGSLALEIPLPIHVKEETIQGFQLQKVKTIFNINTNSVQSVGTNGMINNWRKETTKNSVNANKVHEVIECCNAEELPMKMFEKSNNDSLPQPMLKPVQIYSKIMEIRKNEHFGEILMFWNKRSPISVKVRSKIAEIFILKKADAIEISMSFPRIWRKIIKRSLFNMEQTERKINKTIKEYFVYNEGSLHKKPIYYYQKDWTKKNTYYNSTKLIDTFISDPNTWEMQSIPSELDDDNLDAESLSGDEDIFDEKTIAKMGTGLGGILSNIQDQMGDNESNTFENDENEGEEGEYTDSTSEFESEEDEEGDHRHDDYGQEIIEEIEDENSETKREKQSKIKSLSNSWYASNSDFVSSEGDKTIVTNVKNNIEDFYDNSVDYKEKIIDHNSELISQTNCSLPYNEEEINPESFPFEHSIIVNDNYINNLTPLIISSQLNQNSESSNLAKNTKENGANNNKLNITGSSIKKDVLFKRNKVKKKTDQIKGSNYDSNILHNYPPKIA